MMTSSLPDDAGIILVDHGSKLPESNAMLEDVARRFQLTTGAPVVVPAHMELAEPTIEEAFDRCVALGARQIIVLLYFLSPGRHSMQDIPQLVEQAAAKHPEVPYCITEPLGLDPAMHAVLLGRVNRALALDAGGQAGEPDEDLHVPPPNAAQRPARD